MSTRLLTQLHIKRFILHLFSSTNRHQWGAELQRVLSRDEEYSLVTAEQLVGVCLYIFVRPHLIPYIR